MTVLRESEIVIHSTEEDIQKAVESNTSFAQIYLYFSMIGLQNVFRILHSTFYFYFAPFAVIILSVYNLDYA